MIGEDPWARGVVAVAALLLAGCEPAPRVLPVGRIVSAHVIDEHSAVLVAIDLEYASTVLAVVDDRGAPRWTLAHPMTGFARDPEDLDADVAGDLVLLTGLGLVAADRASGARRWQLPMTDEDPLRWEVVDGRVLVHRGATLTAIDPTTGGEAWRVEAEAWPRLTALPGEYVARSTDITRWVPLPDPGVVMHDGTRVRASTPMEGPRERVELIHGPTGAVAWQAELTGHCRVGATLLATTHDGTLLAVDVDGAAPQPRTVAQDLAPRSWRWSLRDCQKVGDTWWLRQDGPDGAYLLTGVDARTGARIRRGVCSGNSPVVAGRFVLLHGPGYGAGLAAYDLERGVVTWRQPPDTPLLAEAWTVRAGDMAYVNSTGDGDLRRALAFDPATGEITGAATLHGALALVTGDVGPAWVFAERTKQRGPASVVTVDRRTLRPLGPPVPGLDIADFTFETRAGLLTALALVPPDLVFDPEAWLAASDDPDGSPCAAQPGT